MSSTSSSDLPKHIVSAGIGAGSMLLYILFKDRYAVQNAIKRLYNYVSAKSPSSSKGHQKVYDDDEVPPTPPEGVKKDPLKKLQELVDRRKDPNLWNEVLFFPTSQNESIDKFLDAFKNAKISIHLCIYVLSYIPLEKVILDKFNQGINVKMITAEHTSMDEYTSNTRKFKHCGIKVLTKKLVGGLMHNKFAIIDNEVVVTGSMNWAKQGVTVNKENVIITTNQRIVQKYVEEYTRLWLDYTAYEKEMTAQALLTIK